MTSTIVEATRHASGIIIGCQAARIDHYPV